MVIKHCPYCDGCTANVLNDSGVSCDGGGNLATNALFVLPSANHAEQVDDLKAIYEETTGKPFLENCYYKFAVACKTKGNYDVFNSAINYCRSVLYTEYVKIHPKHTFVFGDAYKVFYKDKPHFQHIPFMIGNYEYWLHFYPSLGIKHHCDVRYSSLKGNLAHDIIKYNV